MAAKHRTRNTNGRADAVGARRPTAIGNLGAPRYHFPSELLEQKHFTAAISNGRTAAATSNSRTAASLSLSMLANPRFVSPLGDLLAKLRADGHDVSGCEAEYLSMKQVLAYLHADYQGIADRVNEAMTRISVYSRAYRLMKDEQ